MSTRDTFATPRPGGARRQSRAESAPQYTGAMPAPLTFPATRADDGVVTAAERDEYLDVVLGGDDAAAAAFVTALRARGAEVSAIYLGLLGPTAERLGQLWDDDACDFFDVTIATGRLQRAVRDLGHDFVGGGEAGAAGGRVLLSAMPGEQHTLGLFMVAEYLLRDGWGVRVSTPATSAELAGIMRDHAFDVVGFSAGCDSRLLAMRHEIAGVRRNSRNAHVCVIVGGRIFVDHPELVARVGADGSAASAADASRCARALVSARMA